MEISIERTDCISCGLCVGACPEVYRFADDGLAEVYHQPEPPDGFSCSNKKV